ncbi:hypothetical protein Cfor_01259, partial [Coptotermes formosanus]
MSGMNGSCIAQVLTGLCVSVPQSDAQRPGPGRVSPLLLLPSQHKQERTLLAGAVGHLHCRRTVLRGIGRVLASGALPPDRLQSSSDLRDGYGEQSPEKRGYGCQRAAYLCGRAAPRSTGLRLSAQQC